MLMLTQTEVLCSSVIVRVRACVCVCVWEGVTIIYRIRTANTQRSLVHLVLPRFFPKPYAMEPWHITSSCHQTAIGPSSGK